jgi:hypothetical protein
VTSEMCAGGGLAQALAEAGAAAGPGEPPRAGAGIRIIVWKVESRSRSHRRGSGVRLGRPGTPAPPLTTMWFSKGLLHLRPPELMPLAGTVIYVRYYVSVVMIDKNMVRSSVMQFAIYSGLLSGVRSYRCR